MIETIEETRSFNVKAAVIWNIIGNISRCDWVPGVEVLSLMEMSGRLKWLAWVS